MPQEFDANAAVARYLSGPTADTTLRASLQEAVGKNPDEVAQWRKTAATLGVPVDTAQAMPDWSRQQEKLAGFDTSALARMNPLTAGFLSNPDNAAIAHDDVASLSALETAVRHARDYGGAVAGGLVADAVGSTFSGVSTLLDVGARAIDRPVRMAFGDRVADSFWYDAPKIGGVSVDPLASLRVTGKAVKSFGDWMKPPDERQNLGTDVAGGIGQIGGQIATYLLTGGTISALTLFAQGVDVMDSKIAKDVADPALADTAKIVGGAVTTITEKYGLNNILNRVPPAIKNRVLRFIADKVAAGGIEAGQELAEGILHDIARKTLTNKDAEIGEGVTREMTAAGLSAMIVRTALGVKGHARAKNQEEFVKALTNPAADSKLRQRMPDKFKSYLDQVTQGGPVENIFVPADQFSTYFQSVGLDPSVEAGKLGIQNYDEASQAGTDVVIPTSDFVTQLSGTDHLQGLWEDLRFRQGDLTLRESADFARNADSAPIDDDVLKAMSGIVDPALGSAPAFQQLKDAITGELAGRFDAGTVEAYATQNAALITTLAERSGIDPIALAKKYDLRVDMPLPDALRQVVDRIDTDLDPLLDRIRSGDFPKQNEISGQSLSEFILNAGGLQDSQETRYMDQNLTRKPGQKKMAQARGLSLDMALEKAVEAGYFPGQTAEDLTEADLLDAIENDIGGQRRVSVLNTDDSMSRLDAGLNSLRDYLDTIGADVTTMTNAQIKARLEAASAEDVAGVYDQFAGEQALTADTMALDTAKQRLAAGEDAEAVRKATGWSVGADGKWRFEISDSDAMLIAELDGPNRGKSIGRLFSGEDYKTLGSVLYHPALFAAYPALQNLPIKFVSSITNPGIKGAFGKDGISISADMSPSDALSTMLHEIQHGIQEVEGFAKGGSPDGMARAAQQNADSLENHPDYLAGKAAMDGVWDAAFNSSSMSDAEAIAAEKEVLRQYPAFAQWLTQNSVAENPMDAYRSLAGEVEARNTQTRQGMTDAERAATAPESTADVPSSDVIVTFNGQDAMNAPAPANAQAGQKAINGIPVLDGSMPEYLSDPQKFMDHLVGVYGDSGQAIGLRGIYEDELGVIEIPNSHDNRLGADNSELDGVSTYGIVSDLSYDPDSVLKLFKENGSSALDFGDTPYIAVIEGRPSVDDMANDPGEMVMRDAKTIAYIRRKQNEATAPDSGGAEFSSTAGDQRQTEAFKAWFGDSKVVDADGKPLVVYHGTRSDVEQFDAEEIGKNFKESDGRFFFTGSPVLASGYAKLRGGEGGNVIPAYLSLKNPMTIEKYLWSIAGTVETDIVEREIKLSDLFDEDSRGIAQYAKEEGHDGIYWRHGSDIFAVAFEPTQIKSVFNNGNFDAKNPNILYQKAGINDAKDLVAQHNLTAGNLLHAMKMGGIAVPSLAVTNKAHPLTSFGEITLVAPSEMVDPKGYAATKVFGADIYSPRYPQITYELMPAKLKTLKAQFADGEKATGATLDMDEVSRRGADGMTDSAAVMWQFLTEQGIAPDVSMKDEVSPKRLQRLKEFGFEKFFGNSDYQELMRDEEFQRLVVAESNDAYIQYGMEDRAVDFEKTKASDPSQLRAISRKPAFEMAKVGEKSEPDAYATRGALRAQIGDSLDAEFKAFVSSQFEALGAKEKIFQGFTNSGNRKYTQHTLENVVSILKKELRGGEGFNYGVGSLRAKFTPQFKSIEQIRKAKNRLMDKEGFEAVKQEVDSELDGISGELGLSLDQTIEVLEDAPKMGVNRAIDRAFTDYKRGQGAASEATQQRVAKYLTRLKNLPTEYFEAKILRDVDLAEFKGAVVPEGVDPQVIEALTARGVTDIRTYKPGDEGDRAAKIGEFGHLFFQEARGQIAIGADRKMRISLFAKANLSTFLHESGHFYLEVMGDLATAPDAAPGIQADYAEILKWMGVESREQIGVEQHEQFARGIEAYLREGKAPSPELRLVFQKFRAWLKEIYQSIKKLNVELSPEIRGVFDRMYATDEQIDAAANETDFVAMFLTPEDYMTDIEFAAYESRIKQAVEQGRERLQTKLMRELSREQKEWWKTQRVGVREQVAGEVDADPVYMAFNALAKGETQDGIAVKLSRDDLVRLYGKEFMKRLPRGFQRVYAAEGGVDVDTAAEVLGFDSGQAMIESLVNMKPRAALIDALTDERMVALHGDIRFDGTIADEAMAALHNDKREDVLRIEFKALVNAARRAERDKISDKAAAGKAERETGEQFVKDSLPQQERTGRTKAGDAFTFQAFDPAPMKRAAAGFIGKTQIKELRPQSYLLAERKASKASAKAMRAKDYMTAAQEKQRELFNHYLYLEATRVSEEVQRKAEWLQKQGGEKKRQALGLAGSDYLEQVDDILERYEFKRIPLKQIGRRESLANWVNAQEALGNAVNVPASVLDDSRKVNWKQIPVDELRAVHDAVRNITHLSGLKNKLIANGKQRDFETVKAELLAAVMAAPLKSTGELERPNEMGATVKQKGAALWRKFDAAHMKVEQLVEWLDDGNIDGAWARNFFDLADSAQTKEYDLHRLVTVALNDLRESMPSEWQGAMTDRVDFKLPVVMGPGTSVMKAPTRFTLLSIALNMGNEQNIQRLRDGNQMTDAQMAQVRNALTDSDWKFVQGAWDAIEQLWPEMAALEKRASGLVPEKVEAASFDVRDKTYRGGYFPLVYDSRISAIGERQVEGDKTVEAFVSNGFGRPTTNKGATKKRTEQVSQPLLLDLNEVIGGHVAKVVKDLSHRESVMGLHKILTDSDVKAALIDKLGEAYYRELRDWTKTLVNDRSDSMMAAKGVAKVAMLARTNLAIVTMGWKVSTMMSQFAGFGPSSDLVSPAYLGRALLTATQSPRETWAMIAEKSGEMRNRVQTIDRDMRDAMNRLAEKRSLIGDVQRSAFFFVGYADRMVSVPTWLGAYTQALAEGQGEEAAVRNGDRAVRLSQGAGGAKDMAAVQRNNELMKLMTMYYTPFSALYARLRDAGHQSAVNGIGYLPTAVARTLALVIVPAMLGDLLAGRGPDDDEDKVWWSIRKMLLYPVAALPGIRDFAGLIEQKIIAVSGEGKLGFMPSYNLSPIVVAISKAWNNLISKPFDVLTGDREFDGDMAWGIFESGGLVVGAPTAQVRITGEYLTDLMTGEAQPESAPEMLRDALFRRPKP